MKRRSTTSKAPPQFPATDMLPTQVGSLDPQSPGELSPITLNFITPPVRCKVYQVMEVRLNGIKVAAGKITADLHSFNPKTPKQHKGGKPHELEVKQSMGSYRLRFPVAGKWLLSVEYEGVMHSLLLEVHGQRGKHVKLQSKIASEEWNGIQMIRDEMLESDDFEEDDECNLSSASSTPRRPGRNSNRQHMDVAIQQGAGRASRNVSTHREGDEMDGVSQEEETECHEEGCGWCSHHDTSGHSQCSAISSSMGVAHPQVSARSNSVQHTNSNFSGSPGHPPLNSGQMQFASPQHQPPYPLIPHLVKSLRHTSNTFDLGNDPLNTQIPNESFSHASSTIDSPAGSNSMSGILADSSSFSYNEIGQYGSTHEMKEQDCNLNYIQQDAMYYPIPPLEEFMYDCPSSPSIESNEGVRVASNQVMGYPFLSRMIPSYTSDVVSLGQTCCLIGQNFVHRDHDANAIYFTLQLNKRKVRATLQQSEASNHIAVIPPLSYFGVSYALEPLVAVVELFQHSLLVPCEQQFQYLCTQGQVGNSNKISVQDHSPLFSSGSVDSMMKHNTTGESSNATENTSVYFTGGAASFSNGSSFFFNSGVPLLNTMIVDNNLEAVQTLLKDGADVNTPDLWNITPLHLAVFFGRTSIANLLLRNNVQKSVQTEDINGDTPLDLVIRHWDPNIRGLYDVMVSLLIDEPSETTSEPESSATETATAASAGTSDRVPKPTFFIQQLTTSPNTNVLSTELPFKMEGDTLRVLKPEFWTELLVALGREDITPSLVSKESGSSGEISEEEKRTLQAWSEITKAKTIDSSCLQMEGFPNIPVHAFPVLESLDLSGNALKFLPQNWSQFSKLSKLDVSRNHIDIIPPSLVGLASLLEFSCEENPLRLLPLSVTSPEPKSSWVRAQSGATISNLSSQYTSQNSNEDLQNGASLASNLSVSSWSRTALYRYLQENSSNPGQLITDSKVRVNVLGDQYTYRRLLQKSLQIDFSSFIARIRYKMPTITPSDSLAIEDVNMKSNGDLSFETWTAGARHTDFASQALISPSGIQVIVFSLSRPETGQEAERVQYWLEAISARAPKSHVLLVGCTESELILPRDGFLDVVSSLASSILSPSSFNAAEDLVTVSFANGDGMDALKSRFAKIASRPSFSNKSFPKSIAQLIQIILKLKESRWFLHRSELTDLAGQFNVDVSNETNFNAVVQQLSALGDLVHFPAASSDRLRDIVFIDPQRLCHALTNFIMRHKRLIKDGVLHLSDCHPQFASVLNGLPEPNSSPPLSPSVAGAERSGTSTPPLSSVLNESVHATPRSASPSTMTQLESVLEQVNMENNFQTSARNSKGFLTSPIKITSRVNSGSTKANSNLTSPLFSRVRIDDRVIVDLLILFEEAIPLPQECVMLPNSLHETVSEDLLQQYWSQGFAHAYERVYQFKGAGIPKIFFNRLREYLYADERLEVCLHWSKGMVLRHSSERARLSTPSANKLHLHIAGDVSSRLLPIMVQVIEAVIHSFAAKRLAQVLIPCPSLSSTTTTLFLKDVLNALREGQTSILRGRTNIRLSTVAPDLCLHEMHSLELKESEFITAASEQLICDAFDAAETSTPAVNQALVYTSRDSKAVFNGKLRGKEEVHIAYYHRTISPASFKTKQDYLKATSSADISTMKECREEARLLTDLRHLNIVRVRAFNLPGKLLATETSAFGTLKSFLAVRSPSTSFSSELKLKIMLELAQVVDWMHWNRVVHGAIGLDSVLVTSVEIDNPVHVKLGNFHNSKRLFLNTAQEYLSDIKDLGTVFAQIWTENVDSNEAIRAISQHASFPSNSPHPTIATPNSVSHGLASIQLGHEISELVLSCLASIDSTHHRTLANEISVYLNYLSELNGWSSSSALKPQGTAIHSHWMLESSTRILECNKREIASISSITSTSDGNVWVATASGYIHIWNPSIGTSSEEVICCTRSIIPTYSMSETRLSRRRINALLTTGSHIWCITDGSICVYANDGQLVKSIMHKQSLCITKYQTPASNTFSSIASSPPVTNPTSMVYIGGAHGEISVWDSSTFQCTLGVVLENRLPITAIAVDARYLWIGVGVSSRISHVVVLNKKTLNEICRFPAHDDLISSIVVDDNSLWTSSFDGKINVWSINAENDNKVAVRLKKSLKTSSRAILKLTSSPRSSDGSISKVFASDNHSIYVWDATNQEFIEKHLVGRHRGTIGSIDPIDASTFLSASVEDGCVCIWKMRTHCKTH